MSDPRRHLADRIRTALPQDREVREVAMFGGLALMLEGRLVASAGKCGDLLLRVDAAEHATLVAQPGASTAVMGRDRSMGPGWITVSAEAIDDDEELSRWVHHGLEHHRRR